MPMSAAIQTAKNERERKDKLKAILDEGGNEALYRELYRQTLDDLVELPYPFEDEVYAQVRAKVSEERQAEIRAQVKEEEGWS